MNDRFSSASRRRRRRRIRTDRSASRTRGRARTAPAWSHLQCAARALRRLHRVRQQAEHDVVGMGYDFYAQDSWKPTRRPDARARPALLAVAASGATTNKAMASFQSEFYDPATAPVIDRAGGFVVGSGDRFNGVALPGDAPTDEALRQFPQLAESAAALSRRAARLRRDGEGRLPAAARDGLRPQRDHDVPQPASADS